jgi:hypothetical protein
MAEKYYLNSAKFWHGSPAVGLMWRFSTGTYLMLAIFSVLFLYFV